MFRINRHPFFESPVLKLSGLATVVLVQLLLVRAYYFMTDDAYISFRYAKNLASGLGLVWNPGEYVEGYTNFLWTLLVSAGMVLHGDPVVTSTVLGVLFTLSVLLTLIHMVRKATGSFPVALLAAALLLANRSWNVWATGGLENRMFTFLLFSGFYFLWFGTTRRHTVYHSLLVGAAALTRPDGLVYFAMAPAVHVLRMVYEDALRSGEGRFVPGGPAVWRSRIPSLLAGVLPGAVLILLHFAFRMFYYGELLPNTYYAKVNAPWTEMGLLYLKSFLLEYGVVPVLLLWAAAFLYGWWSRRTQKSGFALFVTPAGAMLLAGVVWMAPHIFYYTYKVGGDHFGYRVFDPVMPFLALGVALAVHSLWHRMAPPGERGIGLPVRILLVAYTLFLYLFLPNWQVLTGGTPFGNTGFIPLTKDEAGFAGSVPPMPWTLRNWMAAQVKLQAHLVCKRWEAHREFWQIRMARYSSFEGIPFPPSSVTSSGAIGVMGYFLDMPLVDELGLTDRVIARNPRPPGSMRLHSHDRQAPDGYLESRGINIFPVCVFPGADELPENAGERCPFMKGSREGRGRAWLGSYQGNLHLFVSPDEAWVRSHFTAVRPME